MNEQTKQTKQTQLLIIPLKDLKLSPLNPRKHFDQKKIDEMAASMKEKGILQPLVVRQSNGKYEIACGARRFKAAEAAGLAEVPAVVREMDDKAMLEVQVIENLQRENVHPLEEAEGYEQLIKKHGYDSADQVADKIGKSRSYVYGTMKLLALIGELRQAFYDGKFDRSIAILLARIPEKRQKKAAEDIGVYSQYNHMTYRRAKEYIREHFTLNLSKAPFDPKDAQLVVKAGSCADCQKRTGNQKELFADISSADVCTDPECFKRKRQAFLKQKDASLAEAGHTVLPRSVSRNLFNSWDNNKLSSHGGGDHYIELNKKCDHDPQKRTYKKLLKDLPPADILIAYDHNDRPRRLVKKKLAKQVFKVAGHKFADKIRLPSDKGMDVHQTQTPEEKAKAQREEAIAEEKDRLSTLRTAEAFVAKIESLTPEKALNGTIFQMIEDTDATIGDAIMERRKIKAKGFSQYAAGLKFPARLAILVEAFYVMDLEQWNSGHDVEKTVCLGYGIDYKKIVKQAGEEAKSNILAEESKKNEKPKANKKK